MPNRSTNWNGTNDLFRASITVKEASPSALLLKNVLAFSVMQRANYVVGRISLIPTSSLTGEQTAGANHVVPALPPPGQLEITEIGSCERRSISDGRWEIDHRRPS